MRRLGEGARVVVTGAAGFAGRYLCRELLAGGYEVEAWVRGAPRGLPPVHEVVPLDLRDHAAVRARLRARPPGGLVHLAALTHLGDCAAEPALAQAVNVGATEALFEALPDGLPAVFSSTCHVYGRPRSLPLTVEQPLSPEGVYARTKAEAEGVLRRAHPAAVVARAFHHTGPGQAPRYALASWAAQLAGGARRLLTGDLSLRRDYTDVRDIVAGYRLLLERGMPGSTVQLCSGEAPPLRDLLEGLLEGQAVELVVDPARLRPDDVPEVRGEAGAAEALGWVRRIPRARMLRELRASFEGLSPRGRP